MREKRKGLRALLVGVFLFGIAAAFPQTNTKNSGNKNTDAAKSMEKQLPERLMLKAKDNFEVSPYTGYTRSHWLEITEKIIAGLLPYYDKEAKRFEIPHAPAESGHEEQRRKSPLPISMRALERSMMAVIIYTKATGKDKVPGYSGSISKPYIEAITAGTDPESPHYWGDPAPNEQVGSIFAMAAYINPHLFWDPLSENEQDDVLNYLKKQTYNSSFNNNHHFFHLTALALLEKHGVDSNREHQLKMNERLWGWYRGDGWFLDGTNQGIDYYNLWGFQLYHNVLYKYDPIWKQRYDTLFKERTERFLETSLYMQGRDGAQIPWGRSITYRFAGSAAIAWAEINKVSSLPPGESRRMVSGALKYFWERGFLSEDGIVRIGYWGSNTSIAEDYISDSDPYWTMHGLAALLLPEDDPFWTDEELPIPADDEGGEKVVSGGQFLLKVNDIDGEARMYPVGQPFSHNRLLWESGAKYDQHAYSSYLGFGTYGKLGTHIGAGRTGYSFDNETWHYRERGQVRKIEEDHLMSTYKLKPLSTSNMEYPCFTADEFFTHTLVGNDGEVHIFWHNNPEPIYLHLGGYGISVPHGEKPKEDTSDNSLLISAGIYKSLVQPLKTAEGSVKTNLMIPAEGWSHSHLYGGKNTFPYWRSAEPVAPHVPQVLYVNGTRSRDLTSKAIEVKTEPGLLKIKFEGKWHTIETLY